MVLNVSEKLLEMLQDSDMALFFLILIYVHFFNSQSFFFIVFFFVGFVVGCFVLFCFFTI